jgi:hypothetical protein
VTETQTTHSAREAAARTTKALKLVDILAAHGASADEARALPPAGRRMCESLAGTRPASDATWEVTFVVLDQRARYQADPFEGLA